MTKCTSWLALALAAFSVGCRGNSTTNSVAPGREASTVLLSITSDANDEPQSVNMAMKLAGFSLDEGRRVVMFFNVKGVTVPMKEFPDDFAFQDDEPIKAQLASLIARGVDVHVCPICMKQLRVEESSVIEGAAVTTRSSLFENIGADTVVFTY